MIHVMAIVTAKPGQRETVLAAFRANIPAVHAEEGCVQYEPVIDAPDAGPIQTALGPDTFCVVERWESMAALQRAWGVGTYEGVCGDGEGVVGVADDPRADAGLDCADPVTGPGTTGHQ